MPSTISPSTQKLLKNLLVYTAQQEVAIERQRQQICSMPEFEPYTAFRRIDRQNLGLVDKNSLS